MNSRHRVLLFAATGTLLLAWQAPEQSAELARVEETAPPPGRRPVAESSPVVRSVQLRLRGEDPAWQDRIFAPAGWRKPPPPAPPPMAPVEYKPPPPPAPPLPFEVLGRWQDAEGVAVFLSHYSENLVARKGDRIAEYYRVEDISEERMQLRYLPLNQLQALEFESTAP